MIAPQLAPQLSAAYPALDLKSHMQLTVNVEDTADGWTLTSANMEPRAFDAYWAKTAQGWLTKGSEDFGKLLARDELTLKKYIAARNKLVHPDRMPNALPQHAVPLLLVPKHADADGFVD